MIGTGWVNAVLVGDDFPELPGRKKADLAKAQTKCDLPLHRSGYRTGLLADGLSHAFCDSLSKKKAADKRLTHSSLQFEQNEEAPVANGF